MFCAKTEVVDDEVLQDAPAPVFSTQVQVLIELEAIDSMVFYRIKSTVLE